MSVSNEDFEKLTKLLEEERSMRKVEPDDEGMREGHEHDIVPRFIAFPAHEFPTIQCNLCLECISWIHVGALRCMSSMCRALNCRQSTSSIRNASLRSRWDSAVRQHPMSPL